MQNLERLPGFIPHVTAGRNRVHRKRAGAARNAGAQPCPGRGAAVCLTRTHPPRPAFGTVGSGGPPSLVVVAVANHARDRGDLLALRHCDQLYTLRVAPLR